MNEQENNYTNFIRKQKRDNKERFISLLVWASIICIVIVSLGLIFKI
jgi:hypothetical protein